MLHAIGELPPMSLRLVSAIATIFLACQCNLSSVTETGVGSYAATKG
jgi:hypothetical protein